MSDLKQKLIAAGIVDDGAILEPLTGGVSSDIYLVRDGDRKLVVKKALEQLKVKEEWKADVSRNKYELRYLKYVGRFLPECVPTVLDGDEDAGFFTMEFLGDGFLNMKKEFLNGRIDKPAVTRVIDALAVIHNTSRGDDSIKGAFDTTDNFIELRVSPYFLFLKHKFPEMAGIIDDKCDRLTTNRCCLVHGDFSPKNILYNENRSVILDCEVAWYGNPAFDVGFFLNHLILKGVHLRQPTFFELARDVMGQYTAAVDVDIADDVLDILPMLLLARVDGKSPAEYLTQESRDLIKPQAIRFIRKNPESLDELLATISSEGAAQ